MGLKAFLKKTIVRTIPKLKHSQIETLLRASNFVRNVIITDDSHYFGQVHSRMRMDNILPGKSNDGKNPNDKTDSYLEGENNGKLKIRIVYPTGTSWNSIGSICKELSKDPKYDLLILVENYPRYVSIVAAKDYSYCIMDDYSLKNDKPDVLIATSYCISRPEISFEGCHNYVRFVISAFPNVVVNETSNDLHWQYVSRAYKYLNPDYYFFDKLLLQTADSYISHNHIVEMGNPQFDDLFEKVSLTNDMPTEWRKLKGKKVFLWATDHGLRDDIRIESISVDLFISKMIRFFAAHNEYGLIIRFHPFLIRELSTDSAFWSPYDFARIKKYCEESDNIVWDETSDYTIAFKTSDAMFVDANCSFIISYLVTNKPICRLLRDDCPEKLIHEELRDAYYYANNEAEMEHFINMVVSGSDCLKEKRKWAFEKSVLFFDGKNGERIKGFIDNLVSQ